jgi:membrane fusion protein (multidrug efflux system)
MPVHLALEQPAAGGPPRATNATIAAIPPDVDATTRNVRVRASVPPEDDWLRPGMFVKVEVIEPVKVRVVAVPETAIVHASYGDSVFVVEDGPNGKVARQHFVELGAQRGDFVAVSQGVNEGQEVVSGGAFKLRNGARVNVDNRVEARPQLEPTPANR